MADHNEPSPLRDIHALLDQAGISPGSLGQRVAGALAERQAWIDRAHELAVERDQAITERNAARTLLARVHAAVGAIGRAQCQITDAQSAEISAVMDAVAVALGSGR